MLPAVLAKLRYVTGPLVLCVACASAPSATPTTQHVQAAPMPVAPPPVAPSPADTAPAVSRALDDNATFGDLVRTARVLIRARKADSSAGCLLARETAGYSLRADLMPALDGLPDAPAELDSQLQRATGPLRALTAFGPTAGGDAALTLAAFTATTAQAVHAPVLAIALSDEGVYLRYGATNASDADGPMPIDALGARVLAAPGNAGATLYVTAEAAIGVGELMQLLRALPDDREVVLAIVLPPDTTLPKTAPSLAPDTDRCPLGLPEIDAAAPQGDLSREAVLAAIAPLRAQAQDCLDAARGAARAGGRVVVALRVAGDGKVARACMLNDAIGDAPLAACVLEGARELRFAAPAPAGVVDVHLPLSLQPAGIAATRALCP